MDTRKGYVKFDYPEDKPIDLLKLKKVAHGAGYTTRSLDMEATGNIVPHPSDKAGFRFVMKSGQWLTLKGDHRPANSIRVKGRIVDWDTVSPVMTINPYAQ